jgi:phenylacetate-CoA ligase
MWEAQWDYVRARSTFYRQKLGAGADRPVTLDGLRDLPLTDKEEIRVAQVASPPYGDYIACSPERVVRIHRTSGTTGRSLNIAFSQEDVDVVTRLGGAMPARARPGLRIVHRLNYQL